ncbi:hypothetical protein BD779DRAFT_1684589 [Infundibulicybe gibba]|nr:hypothetical protein BD779DRAFT_1684589 [Infundibulicybe gibba]
MVRTRNTQITRPPTVSALAAVPQSCMESRAPVPLALLARRWIQSLHIHTSTEMRWQIHSTYPHPLWALPSSGPDHIPSPTVAPPAPKRDHEIMAPGDHRTTTRETDPKSENPASHISQPQQHEHWPLSHYP